MMRDNFEMGKTYQFIKEYLQTHPSIDGPTMLRVLAVTFPKWYGPDSDFPLNFGEAYALDEYFFRGGGRWRTAFGNPEQGERVTRISPPMRAVRVGMFTFDLEAE